MFPGVAAVTATPPDAYDTALSAIGNHVDDLGAWLAVWAARR